MLEGRASSGSSSKRPAEHVGTSHMLWGGGASSHKGTVISHGWGQQAQGRHLF